EQRFEPTDLVTDGAGRDVELVRCLGQAQMPRRRLEGPQGIQWRRHMHEKSSLISRELILCHVDEAPSTSVAPEVSHENVSRINRADMHPGTPSLRAMISLPL